MPDEKEVNVSMDDVNTCIKQSKRITIDCLLQNIHGEKILAQALGQLVQNCSEAAKEFLKEPESTDFVEVTFAIYGKKKEK